MGSEVGTLGCEGRDLVLERGILSCEVGRLELEIGHQSVLVLPLLRALPSHHFNVRLPLLLQSLPLPSQTSPIVPSLSGFCPFTPGDR